MFVERTKKIPKVMAKLLERDDLQVQDLYSALRALNVCRFQANDIREKIGRSFLTCV